jgi:hypothetical protein
MDQRAYGAYFAIGQNLYSGRYDNLPVEAGRALAPGATEGAPKAHKKKTIYGEPSAQLP